MERLDSFIPRRTYGIASAYRGDELVAAVAGVTIGDDGALALSFPGPQPFLAGDRLTVHLDNRTGVEHYDSELRVYRCSWKGLVTRSSPEGLVAGPEEYLLMYSNRAVIDYKAPGFAYPADVRPELGLPAADPGALVLPDPGENDNKLGVWITRGVDRPHSTVMAFLSTPEDHIYLVSQRGSRKSGLIHRDPRCLFAMDHRANFHFERRIDWNYTIVRARASIVAPADPAFGAIQATFVEKNPWELAFFSDPSIELFHLEPLEILCPEKFAR